MKNWKKYVNYDHYKDPSIPKHPRFIERLPEIRNEGLYVDPSTYLKEKDETEQIITPDFYNKFKYVSKEVWQYFRNKYGGGPEFKTNLSYGNNEEENLQYIKVTFMILPRKDKFSTQSCEDIKEYTTYVKKNQTIKQMCERIERVIVDNKLIQVNDPTQPEHNDDNNNTNNDNSSNDNKSEKFHFYKCQDTFTNTVNTFINETDKILNSTTLISPIEPFNMINLECLYSSQLSDYVPNNQHGGDDNEESFLLLVEQQPFIFDSSKKIKPGSCEYCRSYKMLLFMCECETVAYCTKQCLIKDRAYHSNCPIRMQKELENELNIEKTEYSKLGVVGLTNLGNTCFMNSSLQCLSNCTELTNYFLSNAFLKHINKENPIGSKGLLATNYGVLIKNLWYGTQRYYSPNSFKSAIGTFQKRFSGYQQHDTQEFLSYLLDGLHEDLNKVKSKPIISRDEGIGNDEIDSKNSWIDFLRRNQSVVGELFYGQFKSTLICPEQTCKNISITYEPFMTVPLPLGSIVEPFCVSCYYIYYNMNIKPIEIKLHFYKRTNIVHLRKKIATILNIHPMSFIILTTVEGGIKQVKSFMKLDDIVEKDRRWTSIKKFFIFEINPELFYSESNTRLTTSDMEYKKNHLISIDALDNKDEYIKNYKEVNSTVYKCDTSFKDEDNIIDYGIDLNVYERTVIMCYNANDMQYSLPRIVYVNKSFTGKELYKFIFDYYSTMIKKYVSDVDDDDNDNDDDNNTSSSNETLFNKLFEPFMKLTSDDADNIPYSSIPFVISINIKEQHLFSSSSLNIMYDDTYTVETLISKFKQNRSDDCTFELTLKWSDTYKDIFSTLIQDLDFSFKQISRDDCLGSINIYSCFSSFVAEEILESDNSWYCPKCKKHQLAKKKIDIYKPPSILIVHLKRFNNNEKISAEVDFPVNELLDISEYVVDPKEKDNCKYELFGVCNHSGSLSGGHYTAYAKNNGTWYYYNDSHVSNESYSMRIKSSEAYVLFYKKKGIENVNWEEVYNKEFVDYADMYQHKTPTPTPDGEEENKEEDKKEENKEDKEEDKKEENKEEEKESEENKEEENKEEKEEDKKEDNKEDKESEENKEEENKEDKEEESKKDKEKENKETEGDNKEENKDSENKKEENNEENNKEKKDNNEDNTEEKDAAEQNETGDATNNQEEKNETEQQTNENEQPINEAEQPTN